MDFSQYVDQLELLVNKEPNNLMKLAFNVFDFNEDGFIDEYDIYCVMKLVDFQILKDQLRKKRNPYANMTDKQISFLKSVLPKDEVDMYVDTMTATKKVPPGMSTLEASVLNDLKTLSNFLAKKLRVFEFSNMNKESISNRMVQIE